MSYQDYFAAFESITKRSIQHRNDYSTEGGNTENTSYTRNIGENKINQPPVNNDSSTRSAHFQHVGQENIVSENKNFGSASQVLKEPPPPSIFSSGTHYQDGSHHSRFRRSSCERPAPPRKPSSSRLADTEGPRQPASHGAASRHSEAGGLRCEVQMQPFHPFETRENKINQPPANNDSSTRSAHLQRVGQENIVSENKHFGSASQVLKEPPPPSFSSGTHYQDGSHKSRFRRSSCERPAPPRKPSSSRLADTEGPRQSASHRAASRHSEVGDLRCEVQMQPFHPFETGRSTTDSKYHEDKTTKTFQDGDKRKGKRDRSIGRSKQQMKSKQANNTNEFPDSHLIAGQAHASCASKDSKFLYRNDANKKLEICVSFKQCFEENSSVEELVRTAFDRSAGSSFELSIQKIRILPKENETTCLFDISNCSIDMAEECCAKMVDWLRGDSAPLISIIHSHALEKSTQAAALDCKTQFHLDEHTQKGKHRANESARKLATLNPDCPESAIGNGKKENDENNLNVPSIVILNIQKSFESPMLFEHFIMEAVENLGFVIKILHESISISPDASSCSLETKTLADAKRLKQAFHNLQLQRGLKVSCYLKKIQKNVTVQEALSGVESRMTEILESHQEKIEKVKKEIKSLKHEDQDLGRKINSDKEKALNDKLTELNMQKSEFTYCCDSLIRELQEAGTSIVKAKTMDLILKRVGIECNRLRNALPIYARRREIIKQVTSNQVSIILGETGSGKSTQMAQYFYDANLAAHGAIICTQPRRVAASTLATRVATEMAVRPGGLVGYKAGSAKNADEETKIIFATDFGLLNECREDPELKKYSCIIVDEAHERSIYTDILLGMIKACLRKRPELRLVITSATIDPGVFIKYFHSGPELRVSGRNFPVDVFYSEDASDDFEDYEKKAVAKALEIHSTEEPGDILVFLCSPVEIMRCCEEVDKKLSGKQNFKCLPLHGQLPNDEQKKVFEKLPAGQRKIVFATNCAETSITIDGIRYVVDTGVAKEMKYDPKRNISQLGIFVISKSSADQRKGRAGRTASGKCYRLYSQEGFDGMDSISEPEILRVHLGQAVLKLAELGVNIESYDFVQAPSKIALTSAIQTLHYLGAICTVDNKITGAGRWISKLPFDPKLGYFVYEAEKANLLYDAIVLASVISTGSDLFYRGFSETESQIVAKSKAHFGSEHGDSLTWFNVYKSWSEVAPKQKSSWCRSHCVNYKSISYAHQSIQEVIKTISKELKMDVTRQFSTADCDINKLRKILLKANGSFLCNFSGLIKAGYFCLSLEHQVYIHPSSVLKALDLRPEWIVYNELIKTSKEFVKGITIVEEEWVHELVASGKLNSDLSKVKKQKLSCVHHEQVGPSIFRAMVGPRFSNLQVLEEEMWNAGMPGSVLNATKDLCTIDIHSAHAISPSILANLKQIKSSVIERLTSEESEFNLNKGEALGPSGIRVVLGCGGCVKNILMPNQSNKVIIKNRKAFTTEEDIKQKFQAFGEIKNVVQFKSSQAWGFVQFRSVVEAEAAVKGTSKDEFNVGELMLERQVKNDRNMFEAKLTWLRRPIKGRGTAFIKCSALDKPFLAGYTFLVLGKLCQIQISKKGDESLIIFNTGTATEEEIKQAILSSLSQDGKPIVKVEVSLVRDKVPVFRGEEQEKVDCISAFIKKHVDEKSFQIQMRPLKDGTIHYVCFIKFTDHVKGYSVCREISNNLLIDLRAIKVSPSLRTMLHVPKRIKLACQERFDQISQDVTKYEGTTLTWKNVGRDFSVEIKSPTPEDIVKVRDLLKSVIDGEVIECSNLNVLGCLLNKTGQEYLKKVEVDTSCLIITDSQREKIHLYGSNSNISKAQKDIKTYLEEIEGSQQGMFYMKSQNKPPGLMKRSMAVYGPNLDGLRDKCKLTSVTINWKNHCVQFLGSDAAVSSAQEQLATLADTVRRSAGKTEETSVPICSVCICPVVENEPLYRIEVCGHVYCMECLQHQVSFAVNNKEFPLTCASDGCNSDFVLKDLKFALSKKWIDEGKLTSMAVNAYVFANSEKLRFCSTANCPAVYAVRPKEDNCEFICPICSASICTSCHNAFHSGLTCDMAKNQTKADQEMLAWIAANPTDVKRCPGCQWPIQKTAGCNKMHCTACNTFFCWICLETSEDEQDCYRHLQLTHGGFI